MLRHAGGINSWCSTTTMRGSRAASATGATGAAKGCQVLFPGVLVGLDSIRGIFWGVGFPLRPTASAYNDQQQQ